MAVHPLPGHQRREQSPLLGRADFFRWGLLLRRHPRCVVLHVPCGRARPPAVAAVGHYGFGGVFKPARWRRLDGFLPGLRARVQQIPRHQNDARVGPDDRFHGSGTRLERNGGRGNAAWGNAEQAPLVVVGECAGIGGVVCRVLRCAGGFLRFPIFHPQRRGGGAIGIPRGPCAPPRGVPSRCAADLGPAARAFRRDCRHGLE